MRGECRGFSENLLSKLKIYWAIICFWCEINFLKAGVTSDFWCSDFLLQVFLSTVAVSFLAKFTASGVKLSRNLDLRCSRNIILSAKVCWGVFNFQGVLIFNFFGSLFCFNLYTFCFKLYNTFVQFVLTTIF